MGGLALLNATTDFTFLGYTLPDAGWCENYGTTFMNTFTNRTVNGQLRLMMMAYNGGETSVIEFACPPSSEYGSADYTPTVINNWPPSQVFPFTGPPAGIGDWLGAEP